MFTSEDKHLLGSGACFSSVIQHHFKFIKLVFLSSLCSQVQVAAKWIPSLHPLPLFGGLNEGLSLAGLLLSAVIAEPKNKQESAALRTEYVWVILSSMLQRKTVSFYKLPELPQHHALLWRRGCQTGWLSPLGRRWIQRVQAASSLGAATAFPALCASCLDDKLVSWITGGT